MAACQPQQQPLGRASSRPALTHLTASASASPPPAVPSNSAATAHSGNSGAPALAPLALALGRGSLLSLFLLLLRLCCNRLFLGSPLALHRHLWCKILPRVCCRHRRIEFLPLAHLLSKERSRRHKRLRTTPVQIQLAPTRSLQKPAHLLPLSPA